MKFELSDKELHGYCLRNTNYGTSRFLCPHDVICTTPHWYETEKEAIKVLEKYHLFLAQNIKKKYNQIFEELNVKVRNGDKNAADDVVKQMTQENIELGALGYRLTIVGDLRKISPTWIKKQSKKTIKANS